MTALFKGKDLSEHRVRYDFVEDEKEFLTLKEDSVLGGTALRHFCLRHLHSS